jgi:hypothetical protein
MSYKIKTLIVFDTNTLRDLEAGDVAYSSFAFSKLYHSVERFVKDNALEENVTLAVPVMVIEELKRQKQRSYQKDIQDLKKIVQRLTGLPHIADGEIKIPDENFNCAEFIEDQTRKYISANGVNLLEMREEHAPSMLRSMLAKVVGYDVPQRPFFMTGKENKIKDAGFKDNVIWEILMHFEGVTDFDKVIFVTKDAGFNDCKPEFQAKWGKYLEISINEELVEAELRKDYGNYIENRKIYDYARKDYFDDYLRDLLTPATYVEVEGEALKIQNYSIRQHCARVETAMDEEGDVISPLIFTEVVIYTTRNGEKVEIPVSAKTVLSDAEYMEIVETTFEPSIS